MKERMGPSLQNIEAQVDYGMAGSVAAAEPAGQRKKVDEYKTWRMLQMTGAITPQH